MRGDKSGIWRFYRRVWKNIFYEMGDKERFWGIFGMGGRSYIFLKIFKGAEENLKFCGGMYFWGSGVRREREKGERIGIFGLSGRWDDIYYL